MSKSIPYTLVTDPEPARPGAGARTTSTTRALVDPLVFGHNLVLPFRRDGKGDFANATDIRLVRGQVQQVLNTLASSGSTRGELPWRPEFGSLLTLLRFRNLDETTEELARTYVIDAIDAWIPRVRIKAASVVSDTAINLLTIGVRYDILATNARSVLATNVVDAATVTTV